MKNYFWIVTIFCIVAFASCSGGIYPSSFDSCTTSATGDTIRLTYQRPVTIFAKCKDKTTLALTAVRDSRCPVGVQCVWQGIAAVTLQLGEGFHMDIEMGKQVDTTYNHTKISLLLVDVYPYPRAGHAASADSATAMLRIFKSERLRDVNHP